MRIARVLAVPARGGFFNDDLAAIRAGARRDGFTYDGPPKTPGYRMIRQPSEAISLVLVLDSGQTVFGDALSVQYSGAGGRQGPFRHAEQLPHFTYVCRWLEGQTIGDFLTMCDHFEKERFPDGLNRTAAGYAVSQALLQAVALDQRKTPAEVLAQSLGLEVSRQPIPINVQCGDELRNNVDKAILKRADVLPHGLINSIETKLGRQGEILAEYVSWIVGRIRKYGTADYRPELHIDVYGLIGDVFQQDTSRIAAYLADLGERARPYDLCLETPVLMDSRQAQIEQFAGIKQALAARGSVVKIIVDEWANDLSDIEAFVRAGATDMINVKSPDLGCVSNAARAVLACWAGNVRPILGGSCVDTDQSARIMAHVALATRPAWVLARPGMGIDEGLQIVSNEMARTLALIESRCVAAKRRNTMRIAHFDCFSGISGDMTLAALFDIGVPVEPVRDVLASLNLPITLEIEKVRKGGFAATHVRIEAPEEHTHRFLPDVEEILARGQLSDRQRERALAIFRKLAHAEAAVHGMPVERVHFHEVGALDSIADIVGAAVALDLLGVERFTSGPVAVGSGTVQCAHGLMPVPAPATAELLKGVPLRSSKVEAELTTPTGAAILTTVVSEWIAQPALVIDRIGHGAGRKNFVEQPNLLRLFMGQASPGRQPGGNSAPYSTDEIWVLETNLDDLPAEVIGYCFDLLFAANALDVFTTPIQMKKNRPGVLLSILAEEANLAAIEDILFRETTTLGIRRYPAQRHKLHRKPLTIETPWGPVRGKLGWRDGQSGHFSPEYDDCARIARETGIPLREIYNHTERLYRNTIE